ncbi:hypothetical protein [Spirosoma arcticum]
MTERKKALLLHRQGLVTILDFYNKRRTEEGPIEQIVSATDQLLELLLEIDKQIREEDEQATDE